MKDLVVDSNITTVTKKKAVPLLDLEKLKVICALGRGAKGVVFLVQSEDGELFALKAISRASIENNKKKADDFTEYKRIRFERDVLASLQHPLFPKLRGLISTDKIIGYAIDYCPGRDLNCLRKKQTEQMFSVDTIRFYFFFFSPFLNCNCMKKMFVKLKRIIFRTQILRCGDSTGIGVFAWIRNSVQRFEARKCDDSRERTSDVS